VKVVPATQIDIPVIHLLHGAPAHNLLCFTNGGDTMSTNLNQIEQEVQAAVAVSEGEDD
jgi:hypothetical protein